jgi:endonuclease/exonuclease/phosphatase family metal-dependent hydrolase
MKALITLLLFTQFSLASDMSVMTFNTMCDFCKSNIKTEYEQRVTYLNDVLKRHQTDLIALQEVRTGSQLEDIFQGLNDYHLIFSDYMLLSFADPAIAFKKSRFKLVDSGNYWLGPRNGDFSFGWKFAVPRQVLWVKLQDKKSNETFVFMTTHLDNRNENKSKSVEVISKLIQQFDEKVVFAGDINLRKHDEYYQLLSNTLINATDQKVKQSFLYRTPSSNLCYSHKGSNFPDCVVDHVLFSKNKWLAQSWQMDLKLYGKYQEYPSDHRPIIVKLINKN